MKDDVVLVLDCGATNLRAIAVDRHGIIVAQAKVSNITQVGIENDQWHCWPLEKILTQLIACCRTIEHALKKVTIRAITVTTFGVDGTFVDQHGELCYPIISWKCPRTQTVINELQRQLSAEQLQRITGVGEFAFNTIYKLYWLKKNRPDVMKDNTRWLFISSLINYRLTGELTTDATMAGTSQLFDIHQHQWSEPILSLLGLTADQFPRLVYAGQKIGQLTTDMASKMGIPANIPVISAGHDTQLALFGAGANEQQAVLSSGTWEILMARVASIDTEKLAKYPHSTCELDTDRTLYNPGLQWLASGTLEWIRQLCWPEVSDDIVYEQMITQASQIPIGCHGVKMIPNLLTNQHGIGSGSWHGLSIRTTRGHLYRSALESLAIELHYSLKVLQNITGFAPTSLIVVGGGSKNALWNQIKADCLGIPIYAMEQSETTVLGAALYAFYGVGVYSSPQEAHLQVNYQYQIFTPKDTQDYLTLIQETHLGDYYE